MKIAGSFLKIKDDIDKIKELEKNTDQIHFDIMDGIFTENKTSFNKEIKIEKDIDVHLMVIDIKSYVDKIIKYNPKYITFHIEATDDIIENINYIKEKNIKVGLAINPETNIEKIYKYLDKIDLVLLMSVPPGKGGQKFIDISDKLKKIYNYRKEKKLSFIIEIDGGINNETIKKVEKADVVVCGSYITDSKDYKEKVKLLKEIKGFTLAELLGVIIILSIIGLISFSAIDRNLKEGRIKTCKIQEKNIIEGAKTYLIDNPNELPYGTRTIPLSMLEAKGYIEENLINPMTDKKYNRRTHVEVNYENGNNYSYKIIYIEEKGC